MLFEAQEKERRRIKKAERNAAMPGVLKQMESPAFAERAERELFRDPVAAWEKYKFGAFGHLWVTYDQPKSLVTGKTLNDEVKVKFHPAPNMDPIFDITVKRNPGEKQDGFEARVTAAIADAKADWKKEWSKMLEDEGYEQKDLDLYRGMKAMGRLDV